MISKFDPNIPAQESRLQSEPIRDNFRALNDRTDQLTPSATSPVSTNVSIGVANKLYFDDNTYLPFPGGSLELGNASTGVSAFNTPGTFKEIIAYYENSGGTGALGFIEGTEKFTKIRDTQTLINSPGDQVDPNVGSLNTTGLNLLDGKIIICSILVTNNGTSGQRGQIVQIGNADIIDLRPYMQIGGKSKDLDDHVNAGSLSQAHPTALIDNSILSVTSTTLSSSAASTDKIIFVAANKAELFEVGNFIRIPTTGVSVNQITPDIDFITAKVVDRNLTNDTLTLDRTVGQSIPSGRLIIGGEITLDRMGFDVAEALEEVTNSTFLRLETNLSNETEYKLGENTVFDENVDSNANIDGTKIDPNFGTQDVETTGTITTTSTQNSTSTGDGAIQTDGGLGIVKDTNLGGTLDVGGNTSLGGALIVTGDVDLNSTSGSNSAATGALVVAGGVGIGENVHVGQALDVAGATSLVGLTASGQVEVTDDTNSTASTNGSLFTAGGLGVAKDVNVDGSLEVGTTLGVTNLATFGSGVDVTTGVLHIQDATLDSTSPSSGALQVAGGAGIAKNTYIGGLADVGTTLSVGSTATVGGTLQVTDSTNSTASIDGSLSTAGGATVTKDLYIHGELYTGSSNIQLTDATGNILSTALNTVQVAQGGTGVTTLTDNSGSSNIVGTLIQTQGSSPVTFVDYASENEFGTIVYRDGTGSFKAQNVDADTFGNHTGDIEGVPTTSYSNAFNPGDATSTPTANRVAQRDASGNIEFAQVDGTTIISSVEHQAPSGGTSPTYTFTGDVDTGMYRPSDNILGFLAGGDEKLVLNEDAGSGQIELKGGIVHNTTSTSGSITTDEYIVLATGAVTLPDTPTGGTTLVVKNTTGGAFSVSRAGTNTIESPAPPSLTPPDGYGPVVDSSTTTSFNLKAAETVRLVYSGGTWYFLT